jgi:CP family cyanate transporter-like MFS transporter
VPIALVVSPWPPAEALKAYGSWSWRGRGGGHRGDDGGTGHAPCAVERADWYWAGVFALALAVLALRVETAHGTAQLSGMAQGIGYLIASAGLLFGVLHDYTSGWTAPWILFLAVYAEQMVTGAAAGRNRYV